MQIHSLGLDDTYDDEYSLLGIHTTLEDFKLAYLLNKNLSTRFIKSKTGLIIENKRIKSCFSLFKYENSQHDYDWYLIENSLKTENVTISNQLLFSTETINYLIPELKKIDFFVKVSGDLDAVFISKILKKVNNINQVITSYSINKNTLKSKNFLIF